MRAVPALVIACLLAGCAGPRPAPPQAAAVVPPGGWRDTAASDRPIDAQWWTGYDDPALTAIVQRALDRNLDLAIAVSRVEEARAQFALARGAQLPALSASAAGGPQRAPNAFGIDTNQTAGQAQLSVSFDTDLFGRLRSASAAARASLLATRAARDTVRLAIASSAASGYLTLVALDARLQVLRDTLAARDISLKLARRRADAGYSPRLDLAQAEADYHATEQLIPIALLAIRRQEDGLNLLLGDAPSPIARGRPFVDLAIPTPGPSLPAALLRRRPDIVSAEDQLVAADHQLDSARAAFMPTFQLSAAGGVAASTLLPDPISIFSIGGSILAPLFQGGRLQAQADTAAARRDQAAFGYRRAALTAFREVEDAMADQQRYQEQQTALAAQRTALAEQLRLATNRYRAGYSPYLEQLDAQRGLLSADLALVQARLDRLTASVRLYQALGGGWEASADTTAR
ncbi:efflux transporter outer membrane subunit [Sphingomonas sp. AP4-R1]|uniref:efflux transporter outer membrane subunit n=1 Tax=Sphingomonas sp. AP4-R1 TaxID=2735134 RepID=UPI0014933CE7|nr:efflux transporter outer membrane subunit [Sphingomonas sp. AP4-R1]QJU60336.1 efflux transporter outer membrane subunit [Sphingomonas sp. AP4-R1]